MTKNPRDHVGLLDPRDHLSSPPRRPSPGKGSAVLNDRGEAPATDRQRALTSAQRLKRVFAIEIEACQRCGGQRRICRILFFRETTHFKNVGFSFNAGACSRRFPD
jgi:hypothetical protein